MHCIKTTCKQHDVELDGIPSIVRSEGDTCWVVDLSFMDCPKDPEGLAECQLFWDIKEV